MLNSYTNLSGEHHCTLTFANDTAAECSQSKTNHHSSTAITVTVSLTSTCTSQNSSTRLPQRHRGYSDAILCCMSGSYRNHNGSNGRIYMYILHHYTTCSHGGTYQTSHDLTTQYSQKAELLVRIPTDLSGLDVQPPQILELTKQMIESIIVMSQLSCCYGNYPHVNSYSYSETVHDRCAKKWQ